MLDLNTQQVVLLCLLVSFVTSIATGITTVSLLEQAPDPVVQTINRVVERTVERVVPEKIETSEPGERTVIVEKTPEKEIVTIVVKEEDLQIESVQKNSPSLVRLYNTAPREAVFVGMGVAITTDGRIITDRLIQNQYNRNLSVKVGDTYYRIINDGSVDSPVLAVFNLREIEEGIEMPTFTPATFGNSGSLQLAQSVISLSGISADTVSTGIITSLQTTDGVIVDEDSEETRSFITGIVTSVDPSNVLNGSILLNLQGAIVGIKISSQSTNKTTFMPSDVIKAFLGVGQG